MKNKDVTNVEKISLLDLIDKATLEHLLTGFCEKFSSGMKIICYDSNNELEIIREIPDQTKRLWSEICKIFRKNEENSKMCDVCDLKNTKELLDSKNPETKQYRCKPLGMIDMIAPIKVRDKVIGAVIIGQRILDSETNLVEQKICKEYPKLAEEYTEAFRVEKNKPQSKICSHKDIEVLLSNLQSFAELIGNISGGIYSNQLMVKELEDEKNQRESFFERVSHSLSLPMQSVLIDTANLLEEIDSEDVTHLFHEVQGLRLVIQNTLHGSNSSKTIQEGDANFSKEHIITSLKDACEMFRAEAKEKGCDLKITIRIDDNIFPLDISDLKDINLIYKKIIDKEFGSFLSKTCHFIIRKQNSSSKKMNVSELVEYCYLNQSEIFDVLDAATKNKIEFDFSQLSKYYLSPIEMNPEIIDLAWKNLIHNAVKYSYETVHNSKKRYVSIECFSDKDSVGVIFGNYGVGITEEEIQEKKIWEARYRGYLSQDRNRTGAGLGLSHVKWAVEDIHGGEISCTSNRQEGGAFLTKFKVDFYKHKIK